ncbi:MAG TPA: tetratricopeptide repeat protein, partial [Bacteroidales bacterium]
MKLMHILFVFVLLMFVQFTRAQQHLSSQSRRAVNLYYDAISKANVRDYDQAIYRLKEALKEDTGFIEAEIMLGEVYSDNLQDSLAIITLKKAIKLNPDFFPPIYSNLASLEFSNGLYNDALGHVKTYFTYPNLNPKFRGENELLLKSCEFAINAVKNPVPF